MEIRVSRSAPPATSLEVPEFPLIRFDTALVVYQEALLHGQYLLVNASAMGRPKTREALWKGFRAGATNDRPLRTRQHAFQLEVDGQLLADHWEWVEAYEPPSTREGCREAVVVLRHTLRPVQVEVHTRLDGTPLLTRWLMITNLGETPAAIGRISPWSGQVWEPVGYPWNTTNLNDVPGEPFSLGHFVDNYPGTEGSFDWKSLGPGGFSYETIHGRSGWGAPWGVLRNEVTGEACVLALGWSGNWRISLFNDDAPARHTTGYLYRDARLFADLAMAGPAPLRVLAPGETARTPEAHVGYLFGGLDECVLALHQHIRRSVALPQPEELAHRVELNHTGFTNNDQVTEGQLYEEIDLAADAGVELFLLDAGWFGGHDEPWHQTVGDWGRESPLLPSGVKAAFARARERGMLCGLWVEAERMGPASHLLRDHPEWQMVHRGEPIPNLDLSRPEVADYLERTLIDIIERYELDCFRLDYNISVGEGGDAEHDGFSENVLWRYYDALYGIFDRIHQRFPRLLLENCSSGGGRTDLGIMQRFQWTQLTDKWSPMPTLKIVNGATLALPPELCETILGGISDGVADVDFMLRIGLFGHMCLSGIYPTLDERHELARERWRHAIQLYKQVVRPILGSGRLYHHTPIQRQTEQGDWVVLENAAQGAESAYLGVFRLAAAASDTFLVRPKGLDGARRYRVRYDSAGWERVLEGSELLERGLAVRVPGPMMSELLLFSAE